MLAQGHPFTSTTLGPVGGTAGRLSTPVHLAP